MTASTKFDHSQSQRLRDRVEKRWSELVGRRPKLRGASSLSPFLLGVSLLLLAGSGQAVVISFSDPQPVAVVGEPLRMSVTIDHGSSNTHSLFSYGVSVLGNWESLAILPIGVTASPALDFNGVAGPGAFIGQGAEFIGVKGTVNLAVNPVEMYAGTVLAEFQFRFTQPGTYDLGLGFFNTLGPTEDIFVNQDGLAIDDEIEFRAAQILVVIPEPRMPALLLAGSLWLLVRRGRLRPGA